MSQTPCPCLIERSEACACAVINVHCTTDAQKISVLLGQSTSFPLASKDGSDGFPSLAPTPHSSLLCHLCTWAHSRPGAVAPSGPDAWNAFPLDPPHDWLTSSFLQCHPLRQPSLPTPSSTAIPNSSYAPPCFISLINTYHHLTE